MWGQGGGGAQGGKGGKQKLFLGRGGAWGVGTQEAGRSNSVTTKLSHTLAGGVDGNGAEGGKGG